MNGTRVLKAFAKDRNVASVLPSSKTTRRIICGMVPYSDNIVIAEYGPGEGVITRGLQEKLGREINPHIYTKEEFKKRIK